MMFRWSSLSRFPGVMQILFWSFLALVAVFGGASRSDVSAQIIIRAGSVVALPLALLFGPAFDRRYRTIALFLAAAMLIIVVQLIPLPPSFWRLLPGRVDVVPADELAGSAALWRPMSLTPDATLNAFFALLPPLTILTLVALHPAPDKAYRLALAILILAAIGSIAEFMQVVGIHFDNPFINDDPLLASGLMANRNHQAVLLALGIATMPVALFTSKRHVLAIAAAATGIGLWFTCLVLASGSRAGMALCLLAWAGAVSIVWPTLVPALRRLPRTAAIAAAALCVLGVAGVVAVSIWARRAVSVYRMATMEIGDDMRSRSLPTVINIFKRYFPIGSGAGSFDPVFRVHEPFALLRPTYFNHAHNDWLEVAIDTGLPGMLLLAATVAWWLVVSMKAWRDPTAANPRTGSLAILILMLASVVDHPLRTPAMMSVLVLAACLMTRVLPRNNALR